MRYLNAAETARELGIGDKTIRRWLKAGRFPSAIVKANGEYAIPESDVEELKKHRIKYVHTKSTSHDQSDVSALAEKLAALEQEVAELRKSQPATHEQAPTLPVQPQPIDAIPQTEVPQNRATIAKKEVSQKRDYKPRDTKLPDGAILATYFARNHGVARETFNDHMLIGKGPGTVWGQEPDPIMGVKDHVEYSEHVKRTRKDGTEEKERYLTADQQKAALEFWRRHKVDYSPCNDFGCWCHTIKNGE
jgi:predicted DNA-binding transcriptional regulator AlpA